MIYFTADQHFGHANIIKFCERPYRNAPEMDEDLIEKWNAVVGKGDIVYHLGDFTLGDVGFAKAILRRLNGTIFIMPGSHDRWMESKNELTHLVSANGNVYILPPLFSLRGYIKSDVGFGLPIVLCHYAMRTWDASHYGSWHLYGHSHNTLEGYGKSFDVGVDAWMYAPVSFDTVRVNMSLLQPIVDHSKGVK